MARSVNSGTKPNKKLTKNHRLNWRSEFLRLFDEPFVFSSGNTLVFWKNSDKSVARLGITLKGKIRGIWRTRIKRKIREWFRNNRAELETAHNGPCDYNVVVKGNDWELIDSTQNSLEAWRKAKFPAKKSSRKSKE